MDDSANLRVAVTAHCNAGCTFCPIPGNAVPEQMSLTDFQTLFDRLEQDLELVDFSFADDPLLNPSLFEMIAYVRAANVAVNIHTNGLALDEELSPALVACGADLVVINLNTLTRDGEYHPQSITDFHPARVERIQRYLMANSKSRTKVVLQLIAPPANRT